MNVTIDTVRGEDGASNDEHLEVFVAGGSTSCSGCSGGGTTICDGTGE